MTRVSSCARAGAFPLPHDARTGHASTRWCIGWSSMRTVLRPRASADMMGLRSSAVSEELLGLGHFYDMAGLALAVEAHLVLTLSVTNAASRLSLAIRCKAKTLAKNACALIKDNLPRIMHTDEWKQVVVNPEALNMLVNSKLTCMRAGGISSSNNSNSMNGDHGAGSRTKRRRTT